MKEKESEMCSSCDVCAIHHHTYYTLFTFVQFLSPQSCYSSSLLGSSLCTVSIEQIEELLWRLVDELHRWSLVGGSVFFFPFQLPKVASIKSKHARRKEMLQYLQASRDGTLSSNDKPFSPNWTDLSTIQKDKEVSCCCLCSRCIALRLDTWCPPLL